MIICVYYLEYCVIKTYVKHKSPYNLYSNVPLGYELLHKGENAV